MPSKKKNRGKKKKSSVDVAAEALAEGGAEEAEEEARLLRALEAAEMGLGADEGAAAEAWLSAPVEPGENAWSKWQLEDPTLVDLINGMIETATGPGQDIGRPMMIKIISKMPGGPIKQNLTNMIQSRLAPLRVGREGIIHEWVNEEKRKLIESEVQRIRGPQAVPPEPEKEAATPPRGRKEIERESEELESVFKNRRAYDERVRKAADSVGHDPWAHLEDHDGRLDYLASARTIDERAVKGAHKRRDAVVTRRSAASAAEMARYAAVERARKEAAEARREVAEAEAELAEERERIQEIQGQIGNVTLPTMVDTYSIEPQRLHKNRDGYGDIRGGRKIKSRKIKSRKIKSRKRKSRKRKSRKRKSRRSRNKCLF